MLAADASDPAVAAGGVGAMNGIVLVAIRETLTGPLQFQAGVPPPFDVVVHRQFNPEGRTSLNIVPGLLAVVVTVALLRYRQTLD